MSENINLNKLVYNKNDYTKVIDTSFKQLGVQSIQQQLSNQPTIDEFFKLYDELFYNIPELGVNNSHEYLIKTSGDYIGFDANQELIDALQAEIAQLRSDLLESQKQVISLQTGTTI